MIADVRRHQLRLLALLWAIGAVVATVFIMLETNEMFDNALEETAAIVAMHRPGEPIATIEKVALAGDRRKYMTFQIRASDGSLVERSSMAPRDPYKIASDRGFVWKGTYRYYTRPTGAGTIVQVEEYYDERRDAFVGLLVGFSLPLLALLGLSGILITRTLGKVGEPIAALSDDLRSRSSQNLDELRSDGPLELQPMVSEVNALLTRLKHAMDAERAFSANCAHELRNPIASAQAQIEFLSLYPADPANAERLTTVSTSLANLGQRIERLLQLSRAEAGLAISGASADLVEVTSLLVTDYGGRGKRITAAYEGGGELLVACDKDALGIAIQNLIDNALANASSGTTVDVIVERSGVLHVINECPPVSPAILSTLQQRFRRDRTAKPGGYGVGLSIVGELMRQCGGQLELLSPASRRSSGFEAILRIPIVS